MRLLVPLLIWAFMALPAASQSWRVQMPQDAAFISAMVHYPGLGMGFSCHSRSPAQGAIIDSIWFESTTAPPYQFLLSFDDDLVPSDRPQRSDLTVFVDQTGYRLRRLSWNEMSSGWETFLSASDGIFAALSGAQRLVLQVGSAQAWDLPVSGLSAALAQAQSHCQAAWSGTLAPAASPQPNPQPGFAIPAQVRIFAERRCEGPVQFDANGLQAGDLDGDGQPDVVLDWRGVRCPGETISGFCGAANCEINVFLSTRTYAMSVARLAVGAQIVPHRSGRLGLRMGGTANVCSQINCAEPWIWNGTDLIQQP